jgi:hypothetical protein
LNLPDNAKLLYWESKTSREKILSACFGFIDFSYTRVRVENNSTHPWSGLKNAVPMVEFFNESHPCTRF